MSAITLSMKDKIQNFNSILLQLGKQQGVVLDSSYV